jgi:hypothetical protein
MNPKKIVYLIGAGATQAEADFKGGKINLLMKKTTTHGDGISKKILRRGGTKRRLGIELDADEEIDIEKLISLLTASSIKEYREEADTLRKLYFEEVVDGLVNAEILDAPALAIGLLAMHRNQKLESEAEILAGVISLNHDSLFQLAFQKIYNGINLGYRFKSNYFTDRLGEIPPVIMLYGSFNWKSNVPIEVVKLEPKMMYSNEILWIPPSILKEAKDYPYNKLMGLAYDLLSFDCDILRIVGCSLSQNDWNILALLFNAQYNQLFYRNECFKIELIMTGKGCTTIKEECAYLHDVIPISFLTDGDFSRYKGTVTGSELDNPFKYWLREKIKYHQSRNEFNITAADDNINKIME